jgi:ADP-ribose pyrophosphatase
MVFPITRDNEVIYIKEYRFGIEDYLYSFPVGKQELDLDIEENAKKELEEET